MQISIRRKVALSILAYILVAAILWSLNYYNSHLINKKFVLIQKKEDLLNAILEARRYEKNFFLTHNSSNVEEALKFITLAEDKLQDIIDNYGAYATTPHLDRILAKLNGYDASMQSMARSLDAAHEGGASAGPSRKNERRPAVDALPEPDDVRALGREITETIEDMVNAERQHISRLIRDARIYHFSALGGLGVLSASVFVFFLFNVNRPMKTLEKAIRDITLGHYENIPSISGGQEFESLVHSLNHMLKQLNRRNNELFEAKKMASLGTLTSGVAHELNNPLNNISTSLQILLEELPEGDLDFQKELMEGAEKEVERARDIVRALLEFSRQSKFSIKPVAIKSLVEDTIKLIKGDLPANISITVNIDADLQAALDFRRMQQVILNLMVNGIQAMENGGELTIDAEHYEYDTICLRISDTGCGIPKEHLPKIFDPFFTTKETRRPTNELESRSYDGILDQKGTGLGLAICHGIVEKHGGRISVSSEPGKGTTFTVCVPIGKSHDVAHDTPT